MSPFIAALLGQQAAPQVAEEPVMEIPVTMNRNQKMSPEDNPDAAVRLLGNTNNIEARDQAVERGQETSERRGMFGVKGTLRDILGMVGDAFLVQGGGQAYYAPRREREKISDAWAGASDDPIAAAERVGYYDPKMGQELLDNAKKGEYQEAQLESLRDSRQSLMDDRAFKQYRNAREQIASLFKTPGAVVNGRINPQALAIAERIAGSAKMTLEDFLINESMTEQEVRGFADSVIAPDKQERLDQYDRGLDQGQQNADSRRISANAAATRAARPPAGRAPRAETDREAAIRIGDKPANQRTPGEQAFYERYTRPPGKAAGGKRTVPGAGTRGWTIRPRGQ